MRRGFASAGDAAWLWNCTLVHSWWHDLFIWAMNNVESGSLYGVV